MTGQNRGLSGLKNIWPVIMTGDLLSVILSPAVNSCVSSIPRVVMGAFLEFFWSLLFPSRYSLRSWLWSFTFSIFFARFQKGLGWVFIPQRWDSIWSENHRLYRRFFGVIFRSVVLFCRLTGKTDHCAFRIYLYSPLEFLWRDLLQKHTLSLPLIRKQPLDLTLLVCIQGFSIGCLKSVKGFGHWAYFYFCLVKTVFRRRSLFCIFSRSHFLKTICFLWLLFFEFLCPIDPLLTFKNLFKKKVSFARQQGG